MKIVDTHCHLNDEELYKDYKSIILDALDKNVSNLVIIGYDLESSKLAIKIANEFSNHCYAMIGIHPCNIYDSVEQDLIEIEALLSDKSVIGIGEIGLDYHYPGYDKEKQKKYFIKQLELANKYNLPFSIHTRDAMGDTLEIVKNCQNIIKNGGIMHCFSGSSEIAKEFIKIGLYISYGGPLTFTNNKASKEVIKTIPLDRLLFETDSPYLAPHPLRGTINNPSNINYIIKKASEILEIDEEKLSNIEYNNFKELFKL